MRAEVKYTALIGVTVDLETGAVASVDIHAPGDEDETPSEVSVSLESETDEPDVVFDRAQKLVDAAAPFELRGWWAPAPTQRWASVAERSADDDRNEEEPPLRLRRPAAKEVGEPPPYAAAYADVLPESHRNALRDAAVTYLDECFSAIADGEPGQSYADTPIGSYVPQRYEHYYDGRFARDWTTTVAVVGWKLAQPGDIALACVAEELALCGLIRQAQALLDLPEQENDEQAWNDFRDLAFEDEDFLFLQPRVRRDRGDRLGTPTRRCRSQVQRMVPAIRPHQATAPHTPSVGDGPGSQNCRRGEPQAQIRLERRRFRLRPQAQSCTGKGHHRLERRRGPVGTAFGAVDAAVTAINHAIKNARLPSFTA